MSTSVHQQEDLNFNIETPDWVAMKILLRKIDEDLKNQRKHLLMKITNWFLGMELFREFEDKHMILGEPTDRDKEYHRTFLTQLLAAGENLLMDLRRQVEIDPKVIGLDLSDVQAAVDYLRDAYAQWYTDMTEAQKEQVFQKCFGPG